MKFKVGDKVKISRGTYNSAQNVLETRGVTENSIGEIISISSNSIYDVKFSDSCSFYFNNSSLEFFNPTSQHHPLTSIFS